METLFINGGKPLNGTLEVVTAKNALLPILAGSIINKKQVVMKLMDYKSLSKIAQEALIKANDGEAFEIKCPDEITITCKRYYYVADYDEMADFAKREREYFLTKKEEKEQELIDINNKIEKLEEIFK